jgi:mono/diheme cytochrome c family protein
MTKRKQPGEPNGGSLPSGDDLESDVERIHRPLFREPRDPLEGREPAPWWLWVGVVLAIFWGGWYLGRHGGSFGPETHVALRGPQEAVATKAAEQASNAVADPVAAGRQIFTQRCQSCHQENGRGIAGAFPALVGSEWVTGPEETVVRILLYGLKGPITVAGSQYNGLMPAWRDQLTDQEIGAVATYIRQWAPNRAGPVTAEGVAALRAANASRSAPWTAEELRAAEGSR